MYGSLVSYMIYFIVSGLLELIWVLVWSFLELMNLDLVVNGGSALFWRFLRSPLFFSFNSKMNCLSYCSTLLWNWDRSTLSSDLDFLGLSITFSLRFYSYSTDEFLKENDNSLTPVSTLVSLLIIVSWYILNDSIESRLSSSPSSFLNLLLGLGILSLFKGDLVGVDPLLES